MPRPKTTPDAYKLIHEGYLALSKVESQGVRIDTAYLTKALSDISSQMREMEADLRKDPVYKTWQRKFGEKTNLGSHEQLGKIIFGVMGYKAGRKTESGDRDSADEESFKNIDLPFVKSWFAIQKLRKIHGTYLTGIKREMIQHPDGFHYVHPSYNGNRAASQRSTCSDPNFQNNPVRNPEAGEWVRRCYVPRPGYCLVELDYGQIEVRVPCMYHFDPVLMAYVNNPKTCMHYDTASQLFKLPREKISKEARHVAKNEFVFPSFYGSVWFQCATSIWETIEHRKIKVEGSDVTLRDHLASQGITELGECNPKQDPVKGTFEYLVKDIEKDFWERRFKVYQQWKYDWFRDYLRNGGMMSLTGFAWTIPLDKKQCTNYPIQSVAFHLALWSLTRLVEWLEKNKMRSRVIGEVHDCINLDCHPAERDEVIYKARQIMTEDIKLWAPWINVPLVVEPECCPIDGSWFDKMALREESGRWVPDKMDKWQKSYGSWDKQLVV